MTICDFCGKTPTIKIYFSRLDFLPTIEKEICREHFIAAFGEDGKDFIDYFKFLQNASEVDFNNLKHTTS